MATRKMTFSLPEPLARRFLRRVPARERSRYLAAVLEHSLRKKDAALARACRLANGSSDVRRLEREMDALKDPIEEPWDDAPAR